MPDHLPDSQPLVAAFAFGLLVNAAFIFASTLIKRHGYITVLRDGSRLVLLLFSFAATLWALLGFFSLNVTSTTGCQVSIAIVSIFDQLARVFFEQFLLWKSVDSSSRLVYKLLPQIVLFVRVVLGGVFVGFQRPQFSPVCVSHTSLLPLGVSLLCIDVVLALYFSSKLAWTGSSLTQSDRESELRRSRTLFPSIVGFTFWTVLSIPLISGISTVALLLRIGLAALGLIILLAIVALTHDHLIPATDGDSQLVINNSPAREYGFGGPTSSHPPSGFLPVSQPRVVYRNELKEPRITTHPTGMMSSNSFQPMSRDMQTTSQPRGADFRPPAPVTQHRPGPSNASSLTRHTLEYLRQIEVRGFQKQQPSKLRTILDASIPENNHSTSIDLTSPTEHPEITSSSRSTETGPGSPIVQREGASCSLPSLQPPHLVIERRSVSQPGNLPSHQNSLYPTPLNVSRSRTVKEKTSTPEINLPVRPDTWDFFAKPSEMKSEMKPNSEETLPGLGYLTAPMANERTFLSVPSAQNVDANRMTCASTWTSWPAPSPNAPDSGTLPSISLEYVESRASSDSSAESSTQSGYDTSDGRGETLLKPLPPCPGQKSPISGWFSPQYRLPPTLGPSSLYDDHDLLSPSEMEEIMAHSPEVTSFEKSDKSNGNNEAHESGVLGGLLANFDGSAPAPGILSTVLQHQSIINRPRPVRRTVETLSVLELLGPRPPLPVLKRSHSSQSIRSMRSSSRHSKQHTAKIPFLNATTTENSLQPALDNTGSMSFIEKLGLYLPDTPGAHYHSERAKRRSRSMHDASTLMSDSENSMSKKTPKFEVKGTVPQASENNSSQGSSGKVAAHRASRRVSQFSNRASRGLYKNGSRAQPHGASVPSSRRDSDILSMSHCTESQDDDTMSHWGSIHSAVNGISMERVTGAKITYQTIAGSPQHPATPDSNDQYTATDILSSRMVIHEEDPAQVEEEESEHSSSKTFSSSSISEIPLWHYRIGDRCPTFTHRHDALTNRRAPPPSPLELWKPPKPLWTLPADPSPLESPGHALEMLQEQLDKLENINGSSDSSSEDQSEARVSVAAAATGQSAKHEWKTMWDGVDLGSPSAFSIASTPDGETPEPLRVPSVENRRSLKLLETQRQSRFALISPIVQKRNTLSSFPARGVKTTNLVVPQVVVDPFATPTPPDTDESEEESDSEIVEVPLVYAEDYTDLVKPKPARWTMTAVPPSEHQIRPTSPDTHREDARRSLRTSWGGSLAP